jgi:hypothetical protein
MQTGSMLRDKKEAVIVAALALSGLIAGFLLRL